MFRRVTRGAATALLIALTMSAALVGSAVAAGPAGLAGPGAATVAATPSPPGDCPTIMPVAGVKIGMAGHGWTVEKGTTPTRFDIKVLGVLKDGINVGMDMIVIRSADETGSHALAKSGIWAGMSGSPVYVNGKLAGAVSYSLSGSTGSPIGG